MSAILIDSNRSETQKNTHSAQIGENIGTRCGDAGLMLQLLPRPPQWTAAEGSSHTAARVGRTSLVQKLPSFGAETPHLKGRMKRKQGFSAIMLIFRLIGTTLGVETQTIMDQSSLVELNIPVLDADSRR